MSSLRARLMSNRWKQSQQLGEELRRDEEDRRSKRDSARRVSKESNKATSEKRVASSERQSKHTGSDSVRENRFLSSSRDKENSERGIPSSGKKSTMASTRSSSPPQEHNNARSAKRSRSTESRKKEKKTSSGWMTTSRPKAGEKRPRKQADSSSEDSDSDDSSVDKPKARASRRRVVKVGNDSSPASSVSMSQFPTAAGKDEKMEDAESAIPKSVSLTESPKYGDVSKDHEGKQQSNNITNSKESTASKEKTAGTAKIKAPSFLFNWKKKKDDSSSHDSSDSEDDAAPAKAKPEAASSAPKKQSKNYMSSSDSSSDEDEPSAKEKAEPANMQEDEPSSTEKDAKAKASNDEEDFSDHMEANGKASPTRNHSEDDEKANPSRNTNDASDVDDDSLDEDPKKKPKKRGPAKNPLAIQKQELMAISECLHKNLTRPNNNSQDDLWSSDEEERAIRQSRSRTTRTRRQGGRRQPAANARPAARRQPPPQQQVEPPPPPARWSIAPPNRGKVESDSDSDHEKPPRGSSNQVKTSVKKQKKKKQKHESNSDDEEVEQMKREQHPNLPNPTFGPFENKPLPLVNKKSGKTEHEVPAALARYLPTFQREGISFIYNAVAAEGGEGAILGDDMGLGKTLQVISLIAALLGKTGTGHDLINLKDRKKGAAKLQKEIEDWDAQAFLGQRSFAGKEKHLVDQKENLGVSRWAPILVVVPASVVDNWDYEFTMWGHFSVAIYREESGRIKALNEIQYDAAEVMVCGHSLFQSAPQFESLNKIKWKLVVVDEFHEFKNPKSNASKHLRAMKKESECAVLGMTGTPMQNRYEELHNLVDLIHPDHLGPKKVFMADMGNPIKASRSASATKEVQEVGDAALAQLKELLQPIYIQRLKTSVLKDLPKKTEEVVLCELSEEQKQTYKHLLSLPDYLYVRGARCPCDCGVNINYFVQYKRLRTVPEKIQFRRKNEFIKRSKCCYRYPEGQKDAVLWRYQHPDGEPCDRCPFCLLLPCLSKLYQLSSNLSLLQYDRKNAKKLYENEVERKKREAFSMVAFPPRVLAKLKNIGGTDRCEGAVLSRDQFFMMSGKLKKLQELLQEIERKKGRVLLFSYSTQTLDVIQDFLTCESFQYLRIDGSTPSKDRQGLVNEYQSNPDYFCFLLSTRAAGVGLNLTAANYVIIFDAEWNPALDEQAQDRSWRIGQKRDVTVYRLISQGTIDEAKYLRQIYKLHLKQETFRTEGKDKNKAAPRSFVGVEKDKSRRGELFGIENLLKFRANGSFMEGTFQVGGGRKSSRLVAGNADDIAKQLADKGGDEIIEKETEMEMQDEIEKAAKKVLEKQGMEEEASASPPDAGRETVVKHNDLFHNDKVKLAFEDPDEVMGGETQAVDDFVGHGSDDDVGLADDEDDVGLADDGSDEVEAHHKIAKKPVAKKNFELCGMSAKDISKSNTGFSMADIFRPRSAKKYR